jgi:hypothetical protein
MKRNKVQELKNLNSLISEKLKIAQANGNQIDEEERLTLLRTVKEKLNEVNSETNENLNEADTTLNKLLLRFKI